MITEFCGLRILYLFTREVLYSTVVRECRDPVTGRLEPTRPRGGSTPVPTFILKFNTTRDDISPYFCPEQKHL